MYAVVGCTDCEALWLLTDPASSETARCPRCGRRHRTRKLRRFYESENRDAARQARAAMLAERGGNTAAFGNLDSVAAMERLLDDAGIDDREYLEASGLDADEIEAAGRPSDRRSRSRREVVRAAFDDLDGPTEADVVEYASDRGVPAEAARTLLERMRRAGDVTETGGRYRLL